MPLDVTLETTERVASTLTASWGGATAVRAVDVPAGSRTTVTMFLRTGDPRGSATITLGSGASAVTVTTPVQVDPDDTTVVVCVEGEPDAMCTTQLRANQAFADWRGYDVADEVRVGRSAAMEPTQRDAIATWAGRRRNEALFGLNGAGTPAAPAPARTVWPWLAAILALPALAWHVTKGRPRTRRIAYASAVAMTIAGAASAGRSETPLRAGHDTTIHAFAGTSATLAESRLVIHARSDGPLEATLRAPGGWLDGPAPETTTADGLPAIRLAARLGATYRVAAEYPGPPSPVSLRPVAGGLLVENHGTVPLTGCSAPPSLDAAGLTSIAPAGTLHLTGTTEPGDVLRCQWRTAGPPLDASGMTLVESPSALVLHLETVTP